MYLDICTYIYIYIIALSLYIFMLAIYRCKRTEVSNPLSPVPETVFGRGSRSLSRSASNYLTNHQQPWDIWLWINTYENTIFRGMNSNEHP